MKFRPCIDIHDGKVKQIVGGTLVDEGNVTKENYTSDYGAAWFADLYKKDNLSGGHIIILNPASSGYYDASKRQAIEALEAYPKGLQIGGGINLDNAVEFLDYGASHVIVTSFIFKDGEFLLDNLKGLKQLVGKEHIVIDLSCRKKDGEYYIVTNRWQKFTNIKLTFDVMDELREYCDEFLVHGVDAEGLSAGFEKPLTKLLTDYCVKSKTNTKANTQDSSLFKEHSNKRRNFITYAGGIGSLNDLNEFESMCNNHLDYTIGSALDIFGGHISYNEMVKKYYK